MTLTRRQVIERLRGERGQALTILPEWEQALRALEDPNIHEILWKAVRQSGKSQGAAAVGIAETVTVRSSYVIFVSASESQAAAIYSRKIRKPVERLARELGLTVRTTQRGYEIPSLNSVLEVISPNEATAPARSPTLLVVDEARDVPDPTYEILAPSVIGTGGKAMFVSTPGRMRGFFYQLVTHPGPGTVLIASTENRNPYASRGVISFLRERLRLINPAAAISELEGEFSEPGGEFFSWPLIQARVATEWTEVRTSAEEAYGGLDLSRKRDLTSLIVLLRRAARQPEAQDHLDVAMLRVWDPATQPTGEVPFEEVRAALLDVVQRFPTLKLAVDEGAEGGSVLPWARGRMELVTKVEGFTATVDSNMAIWSSLAARLHSGTITLPPNERLLAELRNLRQEPTLWGSKWRITDSARKYHRDISMALALATFTAGEPEAREPVRLWGSGDPDPRGVDEQEAAEEAERQAAAAEGRAWLEERVRRGGGVWFPGDS